MTTTMMDQHQHQHQHVAVTTNDIAATDDNNTMITLVDDDCVVPQPPAAVLEDEIVVGKPSFIDILKLNPNLDFEDKKKKPITIRPSSTYNYTNSITNIIIRACAAGGGIANHPPSDANDRVAVSAAEKRVLAAKNAKDRVRQTLDLKQADCDEAKHGHHAAVSDEQALKGLLKAKNVEISEAQSELKRFKSSGGTVENVVHNTKGLVLLADGLMSIQDALRSSGIGIHDLDWTELFDELLKPMKMEVVSLKETIRKAEVTAKASKKKYDNKTEELQVLKVQLKEAEDVFQEANRELMRLQNKDITKEDVDIIADKEDETQAKDAPDLPCVGQIDLDRKLKETCKEDAGTYNEKTVESKNICITGTRDADKTSEPDVGCNSDGGLNIKEVDDAGEGDLVEEGKNEVEEVKKVELSKTERVVQDTNKNEIHNGTPAASTEPENKKKPNKRERRALAKAALLAVKEKKIKEDVSNIKHDEYGCNLEPGRVSEQILKLNTKEIDDDENTWNEEELDKAELSETEIEEEEEKETISDDSGNYDLSGFEKEEEEEKETANDENHKYPSRKKYRNKKKQKKVTRKARRARAAELKALEDNGERMTCMKMPFAIGCLMMLWVMVMLWCLL